MKHVTELFRCLSLMWKYRWLKCGSVSSYAKAVIQASEVVEVLRLRYPRKRIFWSFSTNHILDSSQEYVAIWLVEEKPIRGCPPGTLAKMYYHGPCGILKQKVVEGYFDDWKT